MYTGFCLDGRNIADQIYYPESAGIVAQSYYPNLAIRATRITNFPKGGNDRVNYTKENLLEVVAR